MTNGQAHFRQSYMYLCSRQQLFSLIYTDVSLHGFRIRTVHPFCSHLWPQVIILLRFPSVLLKKYTVCHTMHLSK